MNVRELVWTQADQAAEARERTRQRAREAHRRYVEADQELAAAMQEVEVVLGPDPRRAAVGVSARLGQCSGMTPERVRQVAEPLRSYWCVSG